MFRVTTTALASICGLYACGQEVEPRPPWASGDCNGIGCDNPVVGAGGSVVDAGVNPDPSASDASGAEDGGEHDRTRVEVELHAAVDLDATGVEVLATTTKVYELASLTASGWEQRLVGETSAGTSEVEAANDGTWFWLKPEPASEWLSSVLWLTRESAPTTIPVFSRMLLQDLGAGLVNNLPIVPNDTMGHVVLQVVDEQGSGIPTVSAEASSGVVAYGVGGTANDVQMQTGDVGKIIWFNAPTGGARALLLRYQNQSQTVTLPVLSASVTMHTVVWHLQMP